MRVQITGTAEAQYLGTIRRYVLGTSKRPARPQAAQKLVESYELAVQQIATGPRTWFSHPRPYPALARYGFRWIKVHRYWFGYLPAANPIITNILDEVADLPAHVSSDQAPIREA